MWSVFIAPGTGVVQRITMVSGQYDRDVPFQLIGRHDRIFRLTAVGLP